MSKSLPADRRQRPRAPLAGRLQTLSFQAPGAPRTLDVSETGARLELAEPLPPGKSLELTMTLVDRHGRQQSCRVSGEVVRSEGREVGIRFRRLLPRHMLQLRDYVWRSQAAAVARPRSAASFSR